MRELAYNPAIYRRYLRAKDAMQSIRLMRNRLKDHTYGRQWNDRQLTVDGRYISDHERAVEAGMRPLTNNLLRSLVKTLVGHFRNTLTKERESADKRLEDFRNSNLLDELDSRALEEFLISGCVIQRLVCERRPGSPLSVWADNISPERFFTNRFLDPRGTDIRFLGHTFEVSLDELKLRFGHGSRARCAQLERCYAHACELNRRDVDDNLLCEVIETWNFDIDPRDPDNDPHWHCRFLAPNGTVLDQTRSPFPSGSHPYALKFYPLTDGEVHPFIEDLINQQKHINSIITVSDHIFANSAKGVLVMPMDAIVPGVDIKDVADLWSKPGGVIPVNPAARTMPFEVNSSSGASRDAAQLLETELNLFGRISGVSPLLQGQSVPSNVSAAFYDKQICNSTLAVLDIFESFNSFRTARNCIALDLINTISH